MDFSHIYLRVSLAATAVLVTNTPRQSSASGTALTSVGRGGCGQRDSVISSKQNSKGMLKQGWKAQNASVKLSRLNLSI